MAAGTFSPACGGAPAPALSDVSVTEWRRLEHLEREHEQAPALSDVSVTEWRNTFGTTPLKVHPPALSDVSVTEWRQLRTVERLGGLVAGTL